MLRRTEDDTFYVCVILSILLEIEAAKCCVSTQIQSFHDVPINALVRALSMPYQFRAVSLRYFE